MTHQAGIEQSVPMEPNPSLDLVKLIRKLRWIGLEEEARELEVALGKFPPDVRSTVVANTSNTD
jgi:hypothetical protein